MTFVTAQQLVDFDLSDAERKMLFERAQKLVTIQWFGTRVGACFDDPFEAEAFRARYRSFETSGVPDMWSCAVRGDNGEPIFWTEPGGACRWPGVLRKPGLIAFLADAVTRRAFFDINASIISFHSAAVQIGNAAVAISANSTGGKSTTAVACARRGMGLYSDEHCVVIDGFVHAFPRALNIRKGGLERLAAEDVPHDEGIGRRLRRHRGFDWNFVTFPNLLGGRPLPQPRRLEAIFFIDGCARAARATPLGLDDAITRLLTAALRGPRAGIDRVAAAAAIVQRARAYGLTLARPDETARLIQATVHDADSLAAV